MDNESIKALNEEVPPEIRANPHIILEKKYQNLEYRSVEKAQLIPKTLHHIWLTTLNDPKFISDQDLKNLKSTSQLALSSQWAQILWVNSKTLSDYYIEFLYPYNIKVKNINEHKALFTNLDIASTEISKKNWGTASDILRYDIIRLGGVYADINYKFFRLPDYEVMTYNFFGTTFSFGYLFSATNYIFGASPNHPILIEAQSLVRNNFLNIPKYLREPDLSKKDFTYLATAAPLGFAYLKYANQYGNIDVLYPPNKNSCPLKAQSSENQDPHKIFYKYELYQKLDSNYFSSLINHEQCLPEERTIGEDPKGAETWL